MRRTEGDKGTKGTKERKNDGLGLRYGRHHFQFTLNGVYTS
jgi:hypothetical protein